MAEKSDIEQLKNILECAICYDMFDNPKRLSCNHHFCKECLEKIIQFKEDGLGTIQCPLRCDVVTVIDKDKSVNDLPLSYEFKAMLELLKTKENRKSASVCFCKQLMCNNCSTKHAKSDGDHAHDISCDKSEGEFNRPGSGVSGVIHGIMTNPVSKSLQTYFDIRIGKVHAGRLIMNLHYDDVPKTCENFIDLCCHTHGIGYKGSRFHYVSRGLGFCTGGDIIKGKGREHRAIYGQKSEKFEKEHTGKGILSMYSIRGRGPIATGFMITKHTTQHWNGYVEIGYVTGGTFDVLDKIMDVETVDWATPNQSITIVNCGVI